MELSSQQPDWVVVGGVLLAFLGFGVGEVVGGVLRAVGQDLWRSYKRRRGKRRGRASRTGPSCQGESSLSFPAPTSKCPVPHPVIRFANRWSASRCRRCPPPAT